MRNRILLLVFLTLYLNSTGQVPSFETVLTFIHKTIDVNPKAGSFEILKKPQGYFICTKIYGANQSNEFIDCQQIWNSSSEKFMKPIYETSQNYVVNEEHNMAARFYMLWPQRKQLSSLLYYGYSEWTVDTKLYLENKPTLTTGELEILARSYYAEANDYIHPGQYGISGVRGKEYKEAGYSKISHERVLGYKKAYDKNLSIWEKIKERDSTFIPNIISDIDLKIGNEYMHGYFTMNCINEPKLAKEYLNKVVYSTSFITYAKNQLNECEPNGILLTGGDSDTYPLWYVQDKLNFRTDVTIINMSLAQTSWYLEYVMDRSQVKSSFSRKEIRENQLKLFVFSKSDTIDFNNWLEIFKSKPNKLEPGSANYYEYVWIDGRWEINLESNSILINKEDYAFSYQVLIYDIISSNTDKTIYATNFQSFKNLGLQDYCTYSGHLLKMCPTLQSDYFSMESELKIIKDITTFPNHYYSGFGNWHSYQRSLDLSLAKMTAFSDTNNIVSLVEKKIISNLSIYDTDPTLAHSIHQFYLRFNISEEKIYKIKYEPAAIHFVNNLFSLSNHLYDDLDQIYYLISMYTSIPKYQLTSTPEEAINWYGSKTLHSTIIAELLEINKHCKLENLKTSSIKVTKLLNLLNACFID